MKKLLAVVLVLGVALVGGGLWVFLHPQVKSATPIMTLNGTQVTLPAGTAVPLTAPVIMAGSSHKTSTTSEYVYVYDNRLAIAINEFGTRTDLGRQGTRIWKSSVISQDDYNNLMSLITSKAGDLKSEYFAGADNNPQTGDMDTVFTINYQGINKTVKAASYFSAYSNYIPANSVYAGMPSPLGDICQKLNQIDSTSAEFYRQNLP